MSLKLPKAFETEVYVAAGGYVAIKQPDDLGGVDQLVLLTAGQLELVIDELQARLSDREQWELLGVKREEETEPDSAGEIDENAEPSSALDVERPTTPPH